MAVVHVADQEVWLNPLHLRAEPRFRAPSPCTTVRSSSPGSSHSSLVSSIHLTAVRMEHAENLEVEFYIILHEILSGVQIAHSNYVIFAMSHGLMLPFGVPIVLGD